ncbi:hypothetical protein [Streptomyces diacarni]|uniref:hypothetical protein n=1 Tax=Streptomyces diacarni TaxID=2800381 RepID=UPI001C68F2D1|nr:hypothetical protein [Streptomyces diacarni]
MVARTDPAGTRPSPSPALPAPLLVLGSVVTVQTGQALGKGLSRPWAARSVS